MRSALILTTLMALLIVGFLVVKNMDSHTSSSGSGRVEEIENARRTAAQAEKTLQDVRKAVNQSEVKNPSGLPVSR